MEKAGYLYDVFISHAVEDKIAIANDLCEALNASGLKVWYSGRELSVGDKVIERIHEGLDQCRFGVVILSPTYLSKIWALNEFFFLLKREKEGQKVILPVLYNITPEELAMKFPVMADIFAIRTENGIEQVTEVLFKEIERQKKEDKIKTVSPRSTAVKRNALLVFALLIAIALGFGLVKFFQAKPEHDFIEQSIQKRIHNLQQKADLDLQQVIQGANGKPVTADEIRRMYTEFKNAKSYYRNEYTLNTGEQVIRSKKNVEAVLLLDMEGISPLNLYTFSSPNLYSSWTPASREGKYLFYNTQQVSYHIEKSETTKEQYSVRVTYTNPIRLIQTTLVFPASASDTKRYQMTITAFRPVETYSFTQEGETWVLKNIE